MRTTLDIEPDILQAVKEISALEKSTAGAVFSRLVRKALTTEATSSKMKTRNGIPVFPSTGYIVTPAKIRKLMDDEGI